MRAWSFSRYETYSKCPWRAKLQYVDKSPTPPKPQADRGTSLHENAQAWVRADDGAELHDDLRSLEANLAELRKLYAGGIVDIEDEWGWSRDLAAFTDWKSAWLRMKLDFHVRLNEETTLVVDYKSGGKDGKQISHTEQGELYAVGAYLKRPAVNEVFVEFWYGDQNDSMKTRYSAQQIEPLIVKWIDRGNQVTSGVYKPRPNIFTCRFCPFRLQEDGGSGACEHAVKIVKPARKKPSSGGFFSFNN